jgi:probable F420-dependent oxidoreductase
MVETVRRAEQLGYDFIYLPEHTIFPVEHERKMGRTFYETMTIATHLAALTSKIRFYTAVLVLTQHHPIYLAKQAATLDVVSNGRIGLGVGIGWLEEEIAWLGGAVRGRGKTLEEYIEVMRALWRDDPVSFAGQKITFQNASFHPKPVQKPLPIYIGGTVKVSPPRAARMGDGWMPSSAPFAEFKEGLARLWREMEANGRSRVGFPVFRKMTLYELPAEIQEHTRETGAESEKGFEGDLGRAREYVEECGQLGVTHMPVLFSTRYAAFREQLESFAAAMIRK